MEAFILDPSNVAARADAVGAIVCEVVKHDGRRVLGKGQVLAVDDLAILDHLSEPIHLVRLAPEDLHEDEAGLRLARAVAGDGLTVKAPVQSRVNIVADRKGLLRVDSARLNAMNEIFGVAVFSLLDRIPVLPGKNVAGAKITPVAIAGASIEAAEAIAAGGPVMTVKPYLPRKVGIVTTEGLRGALQERFQHTVRTKLAWFGSDVIGFSDVPDRAEDVADAINAYIAQGATLILTGGGNTIDPLDPTISALPLLNADVISFGAPAHPGSMFWLAAAGDLPIVNLASCSMYSRSTIADLVLPWIMAGERITKSDMASLGYGGLLDRDMSFRFPAYNSESVDESAAD